MWLSIEKLLSRVFSFLVLCSHVKTLAIFSSLFANQENSTGSTGNCCQYSYTCRGYGVCKVPSPLSDHRWAPGDVKAKPSAEGLSFEGRFKQERHTPPFSEGWVSWTDIWHFQDFCEALEVVTFICAQGLQNKGDFMLERSHKAGFYLNCFPL